MPIASLLDRLFGMNARAILFSALAIRFALTPFLAAASVSLPPVVGHAHKLIIYLAKGEANSCGQGCDRWIAIEGTVDAGASNSRTCTPSRGRNSIAFGSIRGLSPKTEWTLQNRSACLHSQDSRCEERRQRIVSNN
jgi:hypothetical protein